MTYIHRKQITYDESTKRIYIVGLDSLGNEIASSDQVWEVVK